ncbi:regulatory protein yych [Trichococcus palustris]|jgi:regulatory protein YycH of two-component signal transduction system YycFG|uniref:Regulatory protein yych n=1 Tax=Trichococcus palustris TaxID=140314 RepID=A0A143YI08_9LACT|nr:two-component system activity regulator YycH [Trichococcus palustris]CZQ88846.1 regulatory protein yych [Trichococcus palustris]SFL00615.1 Two-component signal transduction system YycFG, regulatory protein YycH [Trichococcus palustris]
MRQKESPILSATLYILVAISLFLTSRILSNPGTLSNSQNTGTTAPTASLTNTKNVEDVFAPTYMTMHTDQKVYLSQDPAVMKAVNAQLGKGEMAGIESVLTYTPEEYDAFVMSGNQLEITFSEEVPLELLSRYFNNLQEDYFTDQINRIIIPTDEGAPIYLLSDSTKRVFVVAHPEQLGQQVADIYEGNKGSFTTVIPYALADAIAYLPEQEVTVPKLVYLAERPPNSFFINLLFDDTTELKDNGNDEFVSYSDNISELSIQKTTGLLSYYRNSLDNETMSNYRLIRNSFHEIKMLDNWTNPFYFYDYDEKTGDVYYRRYVNGFPIFGDVDYGLTRIKMSGSTVIELQFSTQVIQTPLTDRQEATVLISGEQLLEELKNAGYPAGNIQKITVGYDWAFSEESNRIVDLTPKWFIKMDDRWQTMDKWIAASETDGAANGF